MTAERDTGSASASRVEQQQQHRVVLTFDGGGSSAKLICPDDGSCQKASTCAECGRDLHDPESKGCYDCKDTDLGDECWLRGWFDNLMADELLVGSIEFPIRGEWDGDHATARILDPATHAAKAAPHPEVAS